jgi:hypothetical protein
VSAGDGLPPSLQAVKRESSNTSANAIDKSFFTSLTPQVLLNRERQSKDFIAIPRA